MLSALLCFLLCYGLLSYWAIELCHALLYCTVLDRTGELVSCKSRYIESSYVSTTCSLRYLQELRHSENLHRHGLLSTELAMFILNV